VSLKNLNELKENEKWYLDTKSRLIFDIRPTWYLICNLKFNKNGEENLRTFGSKFKEKNCYSKSKRALEAFITTASSSSIFVFQCFLDLFLISNHVEMNTWTVWLVSIAISWIIIYNFAIALLIVNFIRLGFVN